MSYRKKVFIGGSRVGAASGGLPKEVMSRIDAIMKKGYEILVGDANGADKAVQVYLARKHYEHVTIFFVNGDKGLRNYENKNWPLEEVSGCGRTGRELQRLKDMEMVRRADYGLMIWKPTYTNRYRKEAVSSGTLMNIYNLLKTDPLHSRPTAVFYVPDSKFIDIYSVNDLEDLLKKDPIVWKYYTKNVNNGRNRTVQEAESQPLPGFSTGK